MRYIYGEREVVFIELNNHCIYQNKYSDNLQKGSSKASDLKPLKSVAPPRWGQDQCSLLPLSALSMLLVWLPLYECHMVDGAIKPDSGIFVPSPPMPDQKISQPSNWTSEHAHRTLTTPHHTISRASPFFRVERKREIWHLPQKAAFICDIQNMLAYVCTRPSLCLGDLCNIFMDRIWYPS